ncbi:MAG: hypothetical protein WHV61_08575 [Burkholderiales bacterium]
MRTPNFHGLRARLLLLLLLAVLPGLAALGYDLLQDWRSARAAAVAQVQALAAQAAREQRQVVDEARVLLTLLADVKARSF